MNRLLSLLLITIAAKKRYNIILAEEDSSEDAGFNIKFKKSHHKNKNKRVDYDSILSILTPEDYLVAKNNFGITLDLSDLSYKKIKKHKKVLHIEEDKILKIQYSDDSELALNSGLYSIKDDFYNARLRQKKEAVSKETDLSQIYSYHLNNIKGKSDMYNDLLTIGNPIYDFLDKKKQIEIKDDLFSLVFKTQVTDSWGLKRISGNSDSFEYIEDAGKNVIIYVLDTGVDINNPEFGGRAVFKYNAVRGSPNTDQQGHGTHVAGIIGSESFGVSKKAQIVAVKVLDENGTGSVSRIIEGIEFVIGDILRENLQIQNKERMAFKNSSNINLKCSKFLENKVKQCTNIECMSNQIRLEMIPSLRNYLSSERSLKLDLPFKKIDFADFYNLPVNYCTDIPNNLYFSRKKAIINLSVGGEKSLVLNYLIKKTSQKYNIFFSTAAGNEGSNACAFSPSSSPYSITVGAVDQNYKAARFSNIGGCVDLYAPGVQITSLWLNNTIKTISGTSMATPFVTGMLSVYLSLADFEFEEIKDKIIEDAELVVKEKQKLSLFSSKKPLGSLKSLYDRIKKVLY